MSIVTAGRLVSGLYKSAVIVAASPIFADDETTSMAAVCKELLTAIPAAIPTHPANSVTIILIMAEKNVESPQSPLKQVANALVSCVAATGSEIYSAADVTTLCHEGGATFQLAAAAFDIFPGSASSNKVLAVISVIQDLLRVLGTELMLV